MKMWIDLLPDFLLHEGFKFDVMCGIEIVAINIASKLLKLETASESLIFLILIRFDKSSSLS